jgi:hypothetical protein
MGGHANILVGIFYALLGIGLMFMWHYISIYLIQNPDTPFQLSALIKPETIAFYESLLTVIPPSKAILYIVGIIYSIGAGLYYGTVSEERLRYRRH